MTHISAAEEGVIHAPQADVYRFIADYANHHPHFLPPQLVNLQVVRGGVGEGTEITYLSKVGGRNRDFRAVVREPEPGSVLTESDTLSNVVTTYRLSTEGDSCRVRIEIGWDSAGPKAMIERLFAPRMLRNMCADELQRLDHYAQEQMALPSTAPS
jgi:hypothetical protein